MNARVLALLCGAALWAQPQKTAPQPQKVIDDYLRAAGGSKALAQIQTEKIAGSLSEEATGKAERQFVELELHLLFGRQRIGLGRRRSLLGEGIAAAEHHQRGEQAATEFRHQCHHGLP